MTLDINFVRSLFPAFSEPSLADLAFFENAGGSYPCRFVTDRLERFYRERKVQPYWAFDPSRIGGEEMDEARIRLSALLGVEEDELCFGPSTTQNVYVLAQAFREWLNPGDAIVVTNQDHEANSGVWRKLAKSGISVREWRIDPNTGHLDPADLPELLDGAKLLCFPHCSNVVGEINDVETICALAKSAGAYVCVDGVSFAPHGFPNIGKLGPDIYLFSAYKTFGPHQGIMVVRRELAKVLPNQGHHFNSDVLHARFTPAGSDHAQVAACAGLADYVDALYSSLGLPHVEPADRAESVHTAIQDREATLMSPLLHYLTSKNSIRIIGPASTKNRAPTIAVLADRPGEQLAAELALHDIAAGGGDFYSVRPLEAMGVDLAHGVLRLSLVHYTTEQEVERVITALDHVL
ncbi:MAG: aminotransferase class V-fold PLP-dependent enzyme [Boseongicola sp.]